MNSRAKLIKQFYKDFRAFMDENGRRPTYPELYEIGYGQTWVTNNIGRLKTIENRIIKNMI